MVYANNSSSLGINAQAVADNSWGERTMTYNNAPPLGAVLAPSGAFAAGNWVSLDVTSYITGNGTYSFGITTPSSTAMGFQRARIEHERGAIDHRFLIRQASPMGR